MKREKFKLTQSESDDIQKYVNFINDHNLSDEYMKKQENWYKPTVEEQKNILMTLLESSEGYCRAHELYDAAIQNYNPIEYAVKHTREQIETR